MIKIQRLAVIINPVAGQPKSILDIFNKNFTRSGIDWDVFITKGPTDARRYALKAVEEKYDAIAVYGGDGTVKEVSSCLVNSNMPLSIIPGGTANVLAMELGIPYETEEACKLITSPKIKTREIDICKANKEYFILRAGIGLEAIMIHRVSRFLKNELGVLAYFISAVQAIIESRNSRYTIKASGKLIELRGITCLIANSSNLGIPGIRLFGTKIDDGQLDVIIIKNPNVRSAILNLFRRNSLWLQDLAIIHQIKVKKVEINFPNTEKIQYDGEISEDTSLVAEVIPKAVRIII